jgi:rhamnosyl/mannosyltransferase
LKEKKVNDIKKAYKNKKIIFSIGRLEYYKGFEYLIESAKYLDDSYVILIGGKGSLDMELNKLILNKKLESKVVMLGEINYKNLGNYFEASDIFCLPSIAKSEAFGIVQIEAMSFGKPIISTQIEGSGVDWVNKNMESGVTVPIKNSEKIAEAIKDIMLTKERYNKFSKKSKERFLTNFTHSIMINKTINLYDSL